MDVNEINMLIINYSVIQKIGLIKKINDEGVSQKIFFQPKKLRTTLPELTTIYQCCHKDTNKILKKLLIHVVEQRGSQIYLAYRPLFR